MAGSDIWAYGDSVYAAQVNAKLVRFLAEIFIQSLLRPFVATLTSRVSCLAATEESDFRSTSRFRNSNAIDCCSW